jgi:hypothetical protein
LDETLSGNDINDSTLEILKNAAVQLSIIEENLKYLMDDVQKKHPKMILNWRELNSASKVPLLQCMLESHRKIKGCTQLLY